MRSNETVTIQRPGENRYHTTLRVVECYRCGISFGLPSDFDDNRHRKGDSFYCPNGHGQHYTKTTEDKLREEIARKAKELDRAYAATAETREQLATERRSHSATKGSVTRFRNRAQAGMCPDCRRTFSDYADHMKRGIHNRGAKRRKG